MSIDERLLLPPTDTSLSSLEAFEEFSLSDFLWIRDILSSIILIVPLTAFRSSTLSAPTLTTNTATAYSATGCKWSQAVTSSYYKSEDVCRCPATQSGVGLQSAVNV